MTMPILLIIRPKHFDSPESYLGNTLYVLAPRDMTLAEATEKADQVVKEHNARTEFEDPREELEGALIAQGFTEVGWFTIDTEYEN